MALLLALVVFLVRKRSKKGNRSKRAMVSRGNGCFDGARTPTIVRLGDDELNESRAPTSALHGRDFNKTRMSNIARLGDNDFNGSMSRMDSRAGDGFNGSTTPNAARIEDEFNRTASPLASRKNGDRFNRTDYSSMKAPDFNSSCYAISPSLGNATPTNGHDSHYEIYNARSSMALSFPHELFTPSENNDMKINREASFKESDGYEQSLYSTKNRSSDETHDIEDSLLDLYSDRHR